MIKTFLKNLRNYLELSKHEILGVWVLIVCIAIIIASRYFFGTHTTQNISRQGEIDSLNSLLEASIANSKIENPKEQRIYQTQKQTDFRERKVLSRFDPNKDSHDQLLDAGVPPYIAKSIINFREKGGKFYKPEDLKKLYVMKEDVYQKLFPHVFIQTSNDIIEQIQAKEGKTPVTKQNAVVNIDLNTASLEDLVAIRGVGNFSAQLIIDYRQKLGGFVNISQLNEIKKLRPEIAETIESVSRINTSKISKIKLNSATVDELKNHPYVNYNQAKAISNYIIQHGKILDVNELEKIRILTKEDIAKLTPYLELN